MTMPMKNVMMILGFAMLLLLAACAKTQDPQAVLEYGKYCTAAVDEVYACGDYVKGVRDNIGGGTRWFDAKTGDFMDCPVVGPDSMTPGCKALFEKQETMACTKKLTCEKTPADVAGPVGGTDEDGFTLCTDASREGDICTMDYTPVCGKSILNMGDIILQTYGNACGACHAMKVVGYKSGECPAAVLDRSYKSLNPEICMRIKYACPEGQAYFSDETGCGCEKPSEEPAVEATACTEPRPKACTKQYDPVCAEKDNGIRCIKAPCPSTDKVTYGNACDACSDPKVYNYVPGACEDDPSTMPRGKLAAPIAVCDNEENRANAERIGYRCMASCPAGYDSYVTQIRLSVCIERLGAAEFAQMATCTKSTDCASESVCIKTSRATDGAEVPVDVATYRCAPQPYYDYMLQLGGADTLDENGEQSVAIA